MESELITPDEAAKFLDVSPGTLAVWRSTKRYRLAYVKVGGAVKYRRSDLSEFIASRVVNSPQQTERVSRTRRSAR